MNDKKAAYLFYQKQKSVVEDLKSEWRRLVEKKASAKKKKIARRAWKDAEKKLKELKAEWKKAVQIANPPKPKTKKEQKELSKGYPPSEYFKFNLLSAYTLDPKAPKLYIGKWSSGSPRELTGNKRYAFSVEITAQDEMTEWEAKNMLQEYFDDNQDYFGLAKVVHIKLNQNSKKVWGIYASTDRKYVQGFATL